MSFLKRTFVSLKRFFPFRPKGLIRKETISKSERDATENDMNSPPNAQQNTSRQRNNPPTGGESSQGMALPPGRGYEVTFSFLYFGIHEGEKATLETMKQTRRFTSTKKLIEFIGVSLKDPESLCPGLVIHQMETFEIETD